MSETCFSNSTGISPGQAREALRPARRRALDPVCAQHRARVAGVRLEPFYRIRFGYPEGWVVSLGAEWEQHFYIAEGRCEGKVSGRFRGANYPRRRDDGTFRPDFRAVIETDDGATIMFEWHGYGRAYPVGRRQIVGAVFHSSDDARYQRLNDVVACAWAKYEHRLKPPLNS